MSFPRYPAYKASGVEWLGEVPEHWVVDRLKRVARLVTEKAQDADFPVGLENIESWSGRFVTTDGEFEGEGIAFNAGDILFGKLRPYLAKAWLADRPGEAVGDFHVLRPNAHATAAFLTHVMLSREFIAIVDGSTYGAKMPRASWDFMGGMMLPVPPPEEQTDIATFLDRETAKIDALVAEQEKLIALLQEKRQAVISHAVTKGLDPDVPMKDSGVEWLGEVPAHWRLMRLKNVSPCITVGVVVNPSEYVADEGLPFIYGGDIEEGRVKYEAARRIAPEDSDKNAKTKLHAGDLLTVRVGAPGITAVVPRECEGGNCASVMLIRQGAFDSTWLCYVMNSRCIRYQVEVVQYGAAQEQFNISHAINFWVASPPVAEQVAIAAFIDRKTRETELLATDAARAIDLLKERRAALISAAVTGQIDVRSTVAEAA